MGADVELVPAVPDDALAIYVLLSGPHHGWTRAADLGPPHLGDIHVRLQESCIALYQVCIDGDETVGVCSLYDFQPPDQTCWMDCALSIDFANTQPTVVADLVRHAFLDWDVRKLYAISHGHEVSPLAALEGHTSEGTLRARWWSDGMFLDRHISALNRESWLDHGGGAR